MDWITDISYQKRRSTLQMQQDAEITGTSSVSSTSSEENVDPYKNNEIRNDIILAYRKTPFCQRDTQQKDTEMPNFPRSVSQNTSTMKYDENQANIFRNRGMSTPDNAIINSNVSTDVVDMDKTKFTKKNMTTIFSCIYAMLLTVTGGIIYVNNQSRESRYVSEIFSLCIMTIGLLWLIFFNVDLFRYKQKVLSKVMGKLDTISTCTQFNAAVTLIEDSTPPYRFRTGMHSGSFYLKVGLAGFCFGHLINEGLSLAQHFLNFFEEERYLQNCGDITSLISHLIKPIYSFYQLFIVFKYSNIVINRHRGLACFALMHIIATCLCFWFGTIVEDALEDYHHKLDKSKQKNTTLISTENPVYYDESLHQCSTDAVLSVDNIQAIPYLYPFTIEFNILLAGVWFIVWHNIGKQHHRANPHHFQHQISTYDGNEEVTFRSNLVISADCHASNKGLFAGLFILLLSIISIIVFFVAMNSDEYHHVGLLIHNFQDGILIILSLLCVIVAYRQLSKLDYNKHPVTFLDDVLLFVPLPFFFVQSVLTIMSEYQKRNLLRIVMSVLIPIEVILQTPLIINGLRRCSNSQTLRYRKPGREIVTFLIVCNLTMWVINTFEAKSVESQYGLNVYFGEFAWMFISHTTLPLMLFYRFHSSVCFADIWKTAYEIGE